MSNSKKNKGKKSKKVLDGINLSSKNKNFDSMIKDIRKDVIEDELKKGKEIENQSYIESRSIHDQIQSIISILFTIIVFILILVLIFVLYNNYLKKDLKKEIDVIEVCKDYINKDYGIKEDDVLTFIYNERSIIYNILKFDSDSITNKDLIEFSKYIIWNSDSEYTECIDDEYCLDTKKEMDIETLYSNLASYFDKEIKYLNISDFSDDLIRIYQKDDKVILTFKEMEYETLKHDLIKIDIKNNQIEVYFALSKRIGELYNYIGYKKVNLKYNKKNFYITHIETNKVNSD